MKSLHTLIPDIYKLVGGPSGWFTSTLASDLGNEIALRMQSSLGSEKDTPTLRLSQMGPRCPKALWHSIHTPELAEKLPPWAKIKYTYGHTLEAMVICLAKAAGHEVTGEQDELVVDGIKGHRDCIIDGCLVDVKSSAGHYFKKFKDGTIQVSDTFGYLDQLDGYLVGSVDDPLLRVKDRAYLLAIDKHLGHLVLYEHLGRTDSIRRRVADYKQIVAQPGPPACECGTIKDGESGNLKLDVRASYSPFKHVCFPGLRTFLYAGKDGEKGPRYLAHVARRPQPSIIEIDKFGRRMYT